MINVFFEDEKVTEDDLYFICYMMERISRTIKQPKRYIAEKIGYDNLVKKISLASVLHSENPLKVAQDFIEEYGLKNGSYDVCDVDPELVERIPTETQMGKVYKRLILSVQEDEEDYIQAMLRVYRSPICEIIDDYNSSAYYEPSYYITNAFHRGTFN